MAGPAGAPRSRSRGRPITTRSNHLRHPAPVPAGDGYHVVVAANPSPYTLAGTNTYLVGGPRAVVIDPGPDDPAHVGDICDCAAASGWGVALILVTHAHGDHLGAADRLARRTGAPVRRWGSGDPPLRDDEVLTVDGGRLRVLHAPGHAPDHVVFYWEDRAILFSGDLILGEGTVVVAPPGGSMTDYLRALDRVALLDLALICPGHGPVIPDPQARVAEYRAHRNRREQQVLEALKSGAKAPKEIAAVLYVGLDPRLRPAAEGTVQAHLDKLLAEGRVRRTGGQYALP